MIAGYRCANDVSARNLQYGDEPVDARQGLRHVLPGRRPGWCPCPSSATAGACGIVQHLNGELLQEGNTLAICCSAWRYLVSFASAVFTLEPGDLILTGTPSGIGHTRNPPVSLKDGDGSRSRSRRSACCGTRGLVAEAAQFNPGL